VKMKVWRARSKIAALKARGARLIEPGHAIIVLSGTSVCFNNLSTQPRSGGSTYPLIFLDVRTRKASRVYTYASLFRSILQ